MNAMRRDPRNAHHLATVSHDGRFWDAYLELDESHDPGEPARGRLAFSAADQGDVEPVRTATIFMEETAQLVLSRAREFKTHQIVALLRSSLPEPRTKPEGDVRDDPPERERGEKRPGSDPNEPDRRDHAPGGRPPETPSG